MAGIWSWFGFSMAKMCRVQFAGCSLFFSYQHLIISNLITRNYIFQTWGKCVVSLNYWSTNSKNLCYLVRAFSFSSGFSFEILVCYCLQLWKSQLVSTHMKGEGFYSPIYILTFEAMLLASQTNNDPRTALQISASIVRIKCEHSGFSIFILFQSLAIRSL